MPNSYSAGPHGQTWENFVFVADNHKATANIAMWLSKIEFDLFEKSDSQWVKSWKDVTQIVTNVCDAHNSKVGFLRISCHGNVGIFAVGKSIFSESNVKYWRPEVEKIAKYFVPGVSFVTIDACKTGADDKILQHFSAALGGVSVRGYEQNQTENTSAEDGRGPFATCRTTICEWNSNEQGK